MSEFHEELRIVLAGFGGQGLLFAGKVLAYTGLIDDREVSWLPSYGPEMRGGTANCNVSLSDEAIGSPLVLDPNVLIAMNQPSLEKFEPMCVPGALLLVDSSMVPVKVGRTDVEVCYVPATKLAEDAGLKGLANIVLVGKLFAMKGFCSWDTLEAAIKKCVPAKKVEMVQKNLDALMLGVSA
ncbi:MAG: 2-oxoacid:acceptor oxidoreductase family protein [Eggerthellaceae bacterium]|nr:2-oxoacid:acceptor oxidoreductase family protein [Eggerthellaceae bacterium]